jgi:hypothetical protein
MCSFLATKSYKTHDQGKAIDALKERPKAEPLTCIQMRRDWMKMKAKLWGRHMRGPVSIARISLLSGSEMVPGS